MKWNHKAQLINFNNSIIFDLRFQLHNVTKCCQNQIRIEQKKICVGNEIPDTHQFVFYMSKLILLSSLSN